MKLNVPLRYKVLMLGVILLEVNMFSLQMRDSIAVVQLKMVCVLYLTFMSLCL